ncbi:UvrD-helicase domain-containing protein [Defluviitoga tunisiensis]|uniref:DNA 3'-5' helicase n=1 Tax=Defluviitoga tunisiensis TaxID=1006576 RepID=A0A0C7P1X3_DEFTU|nr:UvrD-helicase domain-containing protein [Defluviitoga tunisiensis]CEP77999.1 ATP-dependent exoDNAse (exonuclease V) beta subunit (RecB) [Defluviitoga tunisiensis]
MGIKKVDIYKEIDNPNRNFFISASAGTGKTYLLTQYYLKILETNFPNSDIVDNILAVTFTNKAAAEMKNRIMDSVSKKSTKKPPSGYNEFEWSRYWNEIKINLSRSWIRTIDSFCSRIIRENNIAIGVDPNFIIISDFQKKREIDKAVYSALRVILELYEEKDTDWINFLPTKRKENIENQIKQIIAEKDRFKVTFKHILKEIGLKQLNKVLNKIISDWRLEMSRANVVEDFQLSDQTFSEIYQDILWLLKILSLIACEFFLGQTVDLFMYDFKALSEKVLEVFEDPFLLKKYQDKFKYIIVDEFQDTNYLQKEIFDKLHTNDNYFFYVGDRKQSIYRFRGADVSVFSKTLLDSEKSSEEVLLGELTINRRSHKGIIDYANFISENALFNKDNINLEDIDPLLLNTFIFNSGDKFSSEIPPKEDEIVPSLSGTDKKRIKYVTVYEDEYIKLNNVDDRIYHEVETIAKVIKKLLGQEIDFLMRKNGELCYERRKIEPKDIAILTRDLKNSEGTIREVFSKYNIPFYISGSKTFYNRPEIQAIFAAISCVQNPYNDYEFVRYMMSLLVGMSFQDLSKLVQYREGSLFETFEKIKDMFSDGIVNSYEVLKKYKDLKYYLTPSAIFKGIINENNYFLKLSLTKDPEVAISNVKKLMNDAENYNNIANSFSELVRYLKSATSFSEEEASIEDETSNSVKVMTIHKAKGLEFPIVILMGLHRNIQVTDTHDYIDVEFSLPDLNGNRYYILKNKKIEKIFQESDNWLLKWYKNNDFLELTEANRLIYVGITRAKDLLIPILVLGDGKGTLNTFFKIEKNDHIDIIDSRDIEIENTEELTSDEDNENIFKEVPQENLKDFRNLAYKQYIAPTYLIHEVKPSELQVTEDLEDSQINLSLTFEIDKLFSEQNLLKKGSELHKKLCSAQNLSHIRNMIELGELPRGFDKLEIIRKAFSPEPNKIIKNEWRLMKRTKYQDREYMLFGIPDKVIIQDGEIEILDFKFSDLNDPKKINDYNFQIQFYMYLLKDFGKPKAGYIVGIKKILEPIKIEYDYNFEEILSKTLKELN